MPKLSLIPYLEPGDGKFYLNIGSSRSAADGQKGDGHPLHPLSAHDPFSRLIKAELVSGSGFPVLPLFLLIQRDDYLQKPSELWPVGNKEIERYWQQTFAFFSATETAQNHLFPLKETVSPEGKLLPFHSLFVCTHQNRFFHPPCPTCGGMLELCEDDHFLSSGDLMPYGTTLKRYLYCPACLLSDTIEVYTHHREEMDPPVVRDVHQLIRSWRPIATGPGESRLLPCSGCPEQNVCFGQPFSALGRITPINFYPSYIIAFHAMSMAAIDFLALISGAPVDELLMILERNKQHARYQCLQEWRKASGRGDFFLYAGKTEHFLEILYLKLSFLGEITRTLLNEKPGPLPADKAGFLDNIWIFMPEQNGLLPCAWNFSAKLLMLGPCGDEAGTLPASHPSQISYSLGLIWFFVLLRNRNQSVQAVKAALGKSFRSAGGLQETVSSAEFAPANNFWNPNASGITDIPEKWRDVWKHALFIGMNLLQGNLPETKSDAGRTALAGLEEIRTEIRRMLFHDKENREPSLHGRADDSEIHRILSRLLKECPKESVKESVSAPAASTQSFEETLTQTVILNTGASRGSTNPVERPPDADSAGNDQEVIQETVVLRKKPNAEAISDTLPGVRRPAMPEKRNEEADMPETLILKPSYTKDKNRK